MANLNTNSLDATAVDTAITTESVITFYVKKLTGTGGKYRIELQASPDNGTIWGPEGTVAKRPGVFTTIVAATRVRLKVVRAQGSVSTVEVFIVAK